MPPYAACNPAGSPLREPHLFRREPAPMTPYRLLLLPGDGIGPEVMAEVKRVIAWVTQPGPDRCDDDEDLVGGSAYDAHGKAISDATMVKALAADAVLFA